MAINLLKKNISNIIRLFLIILHVNLVLSNLASANTSNHIFDAAGILPDELKETLQSKLLESSSASNVEIGIIISDSSKNSATEEYIEDMKKELALNSEKQAVFIIVAPRSEESKLQILPYNLSNLLCEYDISNIINKVMMPEIENHNYELAILKGAQEIINKLQHITP